MTAVWRKTRRFVLHNVLHADDTPHRIALGLGLGIFVAFTPTVGVQMIIALALAALFRANKAVCVPMVWITNPVTIIPVYAMCYRLGALLLGRVTPDANNEVQTMVGPVVEAVKTGGFAAFLEWSFWSSLGSAFMKFGSELWVGCLLVAVVAGLLGYVASYWTVSSYRQRRRQRIERRARRRAARFAKAVPVRGTSA